MEATGDREGKTGQNQPWTLEDKSLAMEKRCGIVTPTGYFRSALYEGEYINIRKKPMWRTKTIYLTCCEWLVAHNKHKLFPVEWEREK